MDDPRRHLHESIQQTVGLGLPSDAAADAEELPDGTLLTGWVVMAEWMSPEGERWYSRYDGDGPEVRCAPAKRLGLLHMGMDWDDD